MDLPFDPAREPYVSLATFRKSGVAVHTPVWVARMADGSEARERGLAAIVAKYGLQMRLALFASRLSGRYADRSVIELSEASPAG